MSLKGKLGYRLLPLVAAVAIFCDSPRPKADIFPENKSLRLPPDMTTFPSIGVVKRYKTEPAVRLYIEGIVAGLEVVNVQLAGVNRALFCPGKLTLTLDQYVSILANGMNESNGGIYPASTMMLLALQRALPCPAKQ
jgi:hypothetical protein